MKYDGIICTDECFFCKIGWNGEKIEINGSVIDFCEKHFKEVMKGCITSSRIFDKSKQPKE